MSQEGGCWALQEAHGEGQGSGCVLPLGAGRGNHTPRGWRCVLGIGKSSIGSWRRKRRSSHSRAWERRRQYRQEEGAGSLEAGSEGHGPAGPLGLSQGGLGHGGWIRQGQGQHSCGPSPSPRAVLTYVPAAAAATAVGLGVSNTGAPAPLCRAAPSSSTSSGFPSPRPLELAGR